MLEARRSQVPSVLSNLPVMSVLRRKTNATIADVSSLHNLSHQEMMKRQPIAEVIVEYSGSVRPMTWVFPRRNIFICSAGRG